MYLLAWPKCGRVSVDFAKQIFHEGEDLAGFSS